MSPDPATRATFARLARAAIEKHVSEARTEAARWGFKPNLAWVSWSIGSGKVVFVGLRRHLDWVTGEIAIAEAEEDLDQVPLATSLGPRVLGRMRLGDLIGEQDRWWPAGDTPAAQSQQLEWIALHLRVHLERRLHPHSPNRE